MYATTKQLYEHLKEGLPKDNREPYIAAIDELLAERQSAIDAFKNNAENPSFDGKEEMLAYDRAIQEKLAEMFEEIHQDLLQLRKRKMTGKRYAKPFEGVRADGMFLDKRK